MKPLLEKFSRDAMNLSKTLLEKERVFSALAEIGITPDATRSAALSAMLTTLEELSTPRVGWWSRRPPVHGIYCYAPPRDGEKALSSTRYLRWRRVPNDGSISTNLCAR